MPWYDPSSWGQDNPPLGSAGNPSNYNSGPNAGGFGGSGEISGGGQVPLGALNLPYFQQDRDRLGGLLNGQSPFASGDWNSLIQQLSAQAQGQGPSMAGMAYNKGMQDTGAQLGSMARGSASPAAAYQAMLQQGKLGQGQAAGYAQARTGEMMASQQALGNALNQRDQLNQSAYLNILGQQLGLSQSQLKALMGDQSFAQGMAGIDQQRDAAKLQALSGMLAALGKVGAGGG